MAGLAVASGVLCSIAPALTAGRLDLLTSLKASSADGGTAGRDHRQRSWLVTAQIAVALVLLTSSGLLLNSFVRLSGRELNFNPDRLLAFTYGIPTLAFVRPVASDPADPLFAIDRGPLEDLPRLLERLRRLPGVTGVAASSFRPVDSLIRPRVQVRRANDGSADADVGHDVVHFLVTPGFFATIGAPILRGQELGSHHATPVAVVNEAAARRLWPDGNPVGAFVELHSEPDAPARQVVGVVANIPTRHGEIDPEPILYTPYRQLPSIHRGRFVSMYAGLTVWLRTTDDPFALVGPVRHVARELHPDRAPGAFNTVERQLRAGLRGFDTYVTVLAGFAVAATLLAAIGVYGVMAYAVSQRAREIGVRMTLGAGRREIVQVVARQAGPVILLGLVAGVLGSLIGARLVAAELWGVTPTDVLTYLASAALVLLAAVTACLVPARRALAVDPNVALRSE
jgi:putative ABC transport system permease protein